MTTRTQKLPRPARWLLAAGILALALAGCAPAAPTPAGAPPDAPLHTASTSLGEIVVDGAGMTAYVFDKDTAGAGVSACTGSCVGQWPAIMTDSASPKVEGITGDVGTIELANGSKQVTLDGLPLYTYAGDSAPGDTNGQGVSNIWWVVDPSGAKVTQAPEQDRGY